MKLPKNLFSTQIKILRCFGVELLKNEESLSYKIFSFFAIAAIGFYVGVMALECYYTQTEFEKFVSVSSSFISHVLGLFKLLVLYFNRHKFRDILAEFHRGILKADRNRGGVMEEQIIYDVWYRSGMYTLCYTLSVVFFWIAGIGNTIKGIFENPQEEWMLPYFSISFIDVSATPRYQFAYAFEILGGSVVSIFVIAIDFVIVAVIAQLTAQLLVLKGTMRNVEERIKEMVKTDGSSTRNGLVRDKYVKNVMRQYIDHHIKIIDTKEKVENVCSILVLCVFLGNCIVLCFIMYHAVQIPVGSFKFCNYFAFAFGTTVSLYMYCSWGNELILESLALADVAMEIFSPYEENYVGKALMLLMQRAQRPLFLTAGKFVPLSLDSFVAILKGSVSYFMFLQKINN